MRITCTLEAEDFEDVLRSAAPLEVRLLSKALFLKRVFACLGERITNGVLPYEAGPIEDYLDQRIEETMTGLVERYPFTRELLESAFADDPQILEALEVAVMRSRDGYGLFARHLGRAYKGSELERRKAEQMNEKNRKEKEK